MKRIFFFISLILGLVACADDDSFSTSTGLRLDFPSDTIKLDTVFSRTASSTYTFWVNNRNDNGVKLQSVRLKRGNQTGFRVNVDGMYLDNNNGSQTNDVEIRKNDSVLVVVEITPYETYQTAPKEITDELVFLMESGTEQSVCLKAWAWDAIKCEQPVIERDSVIESDKPLVIYGDFIVKEGAHLTIRNTTLYFHADAGMEVYGTLHTDNCTMRGDRLDRMLSYLPYDRVPGQWKGIRFYNTSNNNVLNNTQIRNSNQGLICDSAAIDSVSYRLKMQQCVVHNCQGDGVKLTNAHVRLENCQLTNVNSLLHDDRTRFVVLGHDLILIGARGSTATGIEDRTEAVRSLKHIDCQIVVITIFSQCVGNGIGSRLLKVLLFSEGKTNLLLNLYTKTHTSESKTSLYTDNNVCFFHLSMVR